MTSSAIVLLIISAISHAGWNFLSKREYPTQAFYLVTRVIGVVLKTYKKSAAITGIGIFLTYTIVLVSMNYVSNVSYVAALRQLSIPIGALMGIVLLKEPPFLPKLIGIGTIFIGLVLAAFN